MVVQDIISAGQSDSSEIALHISALPPAESRLTSGLTDKDY